MKITAEQSACLTQQMEKVSRSFTLLVSYLEEPLRQQIAAVQCLSVRSQRKNLDPLGSDGYDLQVYLF
jgi:hypothetical protein